MMSVLKNPIIPVIIVFCVGMLVTFEYFVDVPTVKLVSTELQKWVTILITFTLTIGSVNLIKSQSLKIQRKGPGWSYSIITIVTFALMMLLGLYSIFFTPEGLLFPAYNYVIRNIQYPVNVSMFGLLGFYIITAAFRAFRFRGFDSTIVLLAGLLVLMGQAPIGAAVWDQFPAISYWIMNVPNVAGARAISIGVGIGAISMAVQVLLGYERGWMGRLER